MPRRLGLRFVIKNLSLANCIQVSIIFKPGSVLNPDPHLKNSCIRIRKKFYADPHHCQQAELIRTRHNTDYGIQLSFVTKTIPTN